jgi:hypothetical protein
MRGHAMRKMPAPVVMVGKHPGAAALGGAIVALVCGWIGLGLGGGMLAVVTAVIGLVLGALWGAHMADSTAGPT